ncbi:hypothetical protein CR205_02010 [Alteribacter lacisalsi]|uniref:STAS domain-containing protein n=1 Tax=Alteribacter lacisalsi TaxID=2045244 RepID=A0A2W0HBL1_9BACI|nr:hypothetical protein [Alteribacter lacisalsi]PYZ97400.1 hypothetical protein CR205_02010 [Alteribacter lacisalsi]
MQKQVSEALDYERLFDHLPDNIFIINQACELKWMNRQAVELVKDFLNYLPVETPEELIGFPVASLHEFNSMFHKIIEKDRFPYRKTVTIFGYIADLHIDKLFTPEGDHTGCVLFWRDVTKEKEKERRSERLIEEISTPILPVVIEKALFAPLIGTFDEIRLDHLRNKVLSKISETGAEYIIFDFSGITAIEDGSLVSEFTKLQEVVQLMGAQAYFTGFQTSLVKDFVANGMKFNDKTFAHYRQAITHILHLEGLEITPKRNEKA